MKATSSAAATKLQGARYPRLPPCRRAASSATAVRPTDDDRSKLPLNDAARRKGADRDLFLDVLSATASKREAKSYISNFKPAHEPKRGLAAAPSTPWGSDVNLGSLYLPVRSVEQSPRFSQTPELQSFADPETEPLRAALVLMRLGDAAVDDGMLASVGRTLSQLARLGLIPVIVADGGDGSHGQGAERRTAERQLAARIVAAVETTPEQKASLVDAAFETGAAGSARLSDPARIIRPLRRGTIPVVMPLGFDVETHTISPMPAEEAVLALTRSFAGLAQHPEPAERALSLDRLIVLSGGGGIPAAASGWHVFINLEQEYADIRTHLSSLPASTHLADLQLARDALALLPPSSSALIATPAAAASSAPASSPRGVGTRPSRNPLIHNLLTDKPAFSASLPASRQAAPHQPGANPPTFIKRGLPVAIFPDPRARLWTPPGPGALPPALDLDRLTALIDDSFGRRLDAAAYFARIAPRLAGVVVAGEYEGCAVLTWETPAGQDAAEPASQPTPVPYLDKFAVRRRSQGAGGVADVLFNAVVRDCFPRGVVWRSRADNPVNRWYFERARGNWRIPPAAGGQAWTMFWTTEGVGGLRFREYEAVCSAIGTCWADGKPAE